MREQSQAILPILQRRLYMKGSRRKRTLLTAVMICIIAVAMVGIGLSGAYFSDTKAGAITGNVGSINVSTSNLNLAFNNLLPGEPQSVIVDYTNTGTSPMDVWIVFPNDAALHALNDLGSYGSVSIVDVAGGVNWSSTNLNDNPKYTAGQADDVNPGNGAIYPLPSKMLLQSNVAANAGGSMTFTFAYASKLGTASHSSGGGSWNSYPLVSPTSSGLPYAIVATQVGQTP